MKEIATSVQEGAAAYLNRQFRTLAIFAVIVFAVLFVLPADSTGGVRSAGRCSSSSARVLGDHPAMSGCGSPWRANVARRGRGSASPARNRASGFASRPVVSPACSLSGWACSVPPCVVLVYKGDAPKVLEGFGFGAALVAMFMGVGGGIFTKAADVGGDLVGKVEKHIPEDDRRNPATIADNVGDNVGDCAGMAADLFESYAVTLVAALILGKAAIGEMGLGVPARGARHRRDHSGHRHLRRRAPRR